MQLVRLVDANFAEGLARAEPVLARQGFRKVGPARFERGSRSGSVFGMEPRAFHVVVRLTEAAGGALALTFEAQTAFQANRALYRALVEAEADALVAALRGLPVPDLAPLERQITRRNLALFALLLLVLVPPLCAAEAFAITHSVKLSAFSALVALPVAWFVGAMSVRRHAPPRE